MVYFYIYIYILGARKTWLSKFTLDNVTWCIFSHEPILLIQFVTGTQSQDCDGRPNPIVPCPGIL